nr:ATPase [Gordonia sp. NB41Y]
MDNDIRRALESIRLDWADTPDDVWGAGASLHVGGLHEQTLDEVMRVYGDAKRSASGSPIGVAVRGPAGSGKTHLLGQVRERVQSDGGYFFLVKLLDGTNFWKSATVAILEDLARPTPTHRSQLVQLIDRLAQDAELDDASRRAVTGDAPLTPKALEALVHGVYSRHPRHRRRSQHILRALVLTASDDFDARDLGEAFLHLDVEDAQELAEWGIRNAQLGYQEIVQNISRIVAFDGAAVLAVDQIDTLIEAGKNATHGEEKSIVEQLAHDLMSLRDNLSRTATVVSCITAAWQYLESHVMRSAVDRFRQPPALQRPTSADFGRLLLSKRFARGFAEVDFRPLFSTWPVTDTAFVDAVDYTPRELMITVDRQIGKMLRTDVFDEITSFAGTVTTQDTAAAAAAARTSTADGVLPRDSAAAPANDISDRPEFASLDHRYAELIKSVDPLPALVPQSEDQVVPSLLQAGLAAWIEALPDGAENWQLDPKPGSKPVLHAKIRQIIDQHRDIEQSWSFRAIAATHARSVQTKLAAATTAAGLSLGRIERSLVVLRRSDWPSGPKTAQMVNELNSRGGRVISWSEDDIRRLMALTQMRSEGAPMFREWTAARHPAGEIDCLTVILGFTRETEDSHPAPASTSFPPAPASPTRDHHPEHAARATPPAPSSAQAAPAPTAAPVLRPSGASGVLTIGRRVTNDEPLTIPLLALRKHAAIFAGSGSGKTVLIRRIVEEAALQGVSSIVLDINNDLSRLGTPWPEDDPRPWAPEDRALADTYFDQTEVVVFTPGRNSGRPLSFQPLPDFPSLAEGTDEFNAAVDSAVGALTPKAITGRSNRSSHYEAVLRQTMAAFARGGGSSMRGFIAMLEELPDSVSNLSDAPKLAADLAENLKASMANDPIFGGDAAPADPGVLLTPSPGYRARVSVINLAGLGGQGPAANFVGQLQMALFAWIKKHPAADRPLGGLLVMDEAQNFAPATGTTTATSSTLALASQARKYGLGMIFATQSPTGISNRVSGNAATQFIGLLNHPTQINNAKELAARKGSQISDVGRLPAGTFYAAVDGGRFTKVATPLSLSHHPHSPPTEDEVVEIARRGAPVRQV